MDPANNIFSKLEYTPLLYNNNATLLSLKHKTPEQSVYTHIYSYCILYSLYCAVQYHAVQQYTQLSNLQHTGYTVPKNKKVLNSTSTHSRDVASLSAAVLSYTVVHSYSFYCTCLLLLLSSKKLLFSAATFWLSNKTRHIKRNTVRQHTVYTASIIVQSQSGSTSVMKVTRFTSLEPT